MRLWSCQERLWNLSRRCLDNRRTNSTMMPQVHLHMPHERGYSIREHVLDMMVQFNIAEANGAVIDERSQVAFILESLPKCFLQFRINAMMKKTQFNLTSLLKNKGKIEREASVAHSKRKFEKGLSSGTKAVSQSSTSKKIQKNKGNKGKAPAAAAKGKGKTKLPDKGKCFHCNVDGH
ncbi:uncharacterized protein LOC120067510 [Benincasa hispida]|uniref:uncharacterized protein LOC120067510 n=1 Tax=Benincasa hispida TaxID=102211 RepID=UPI001901B5AE|nr:uncharacterized protein LOC120067510 [Benincasa hispida]